MQLFYWFQVKEQSVFTWKLQEVASSHAELEKVAEELLKLSTSTLLHILLELTWKFCRNT